MENEANIFDLPESSKKPDPAAVDVSNGKKHITVVLKENHDNINRKVNELNGYYKDLDSFYDNRYKFIRYKQDMISDRKMFAIIYNKIMAKSSRVWSDCMTAYNMGGHHGISNEFLTDEDLLNPPTNESGRKAVERAIKAKVESIAMEIDEHITFINDTIKNIEHMHYSLPHIIEMYKINNGLA